MGLIESLATAAGLRVRKIGSLVLIDAKDVELFLSAAETHNVAVLGFEGFRLEGSCVAPDMDAIADFSSLPSDDHHATITEARRVVADVSRPDLFFDFTLVKSR